jgi:hypothetical protein
MALPPFSFPQIIGRYKGKVNEKGNESLEIMPVIRRSMLRGIGLSTA